MAYPQVKFKNLFDFVVAGFAAGGAVHEAILADAYVNLRLTEAAILLAVAFVFGHFALHAAVFCFSGRGHAETLALGLFPGKYRW
jgi:hypothetical protein